MKRVLVGFMAVAMATSMLACGSSGDTSADGNGGAAVAEEGTSIATIAISPQVEKIYETNDSIINLDDDMIVYQNSSGKYGAVDILTNNDTGAYYDDLKVIAPGYCVVVTDSTKADPKNTGVVSQYGVVDSKGTVIVPESYAEIDTLNDRFVIAYELGSATFDTEDVISVTSSGLYLTNVNGAIARYKYTWYVYDLTTGQKVAGVTGAKHNFSVTASGNFIHYTDDADASHFIYYTGEEVPETYNVFDDGSYEMKASGANTVYDTDKNLLFTYDPTAYTLSTYKVGDYYKASTGTSYALVDKTGAIVTSWFTSDITGVANGIVLCDGGFIYSFDGTALSSENISSVYCSSAYPDYYVLRSSDESKIVIDKSGNVFAIFESEANVYTENYGANISETCYSYKDGGYTLSGHSCGVFTCKATNADYTYNLVSTITGDTLLKGYDSLSESHLDSGDYIIAKNTNGATEIYKQK